MEPLRTTPDIRPVRNVIQHFWVFVQRRIHKAHGPFPRFEAFFVDQGEHRGEQRRCQTRSIPVKIGSSGLGPELGAVGSDIGVASSDSVVDALRFVNVDGELGVVWVRWVGLGEVLCDCSLLVSGLSIIVGETAGGGEVLSCAAKIDVHYAFGRVDCLVSVKHCGAHGRDIWATEQESALVGSRGYGSSTLKGTED